MYFILNILVSFNMCRSHTHTIRQRVKEWGVNHFVLFSRMSSASPPFLETWKREQNSCPFVLVKEESKYMSLQVLMYTSYFVIVKQKIEGNNNLGTKK